MSEGKYDQQVLKAARKQFSAFGFYGARIDTIAASARVNKRMVYEFCHTKDGLYMIALSDVSREAMERFQGIIPILQSAPTVRSVYELLLNLLYTLDHFVRLWAWERMNMTIHGPRILETANGIFARTRDIIKTRFPNCTITDAKFEAIDALCHSYLLMTAMYIQNESSEENDSDTSDNETKDFSRAPEFLHLTREITLKSIFQLIED